MTTTYGEFCAGYGGLGLAVEQAFGARLAWYSEFEKAPSAIMAHHWPDAPNHGDMTTIDFQQVEHVTILSGGTPCQDLSHAGRRAGMRTGTRSGLWESMREAIATIRPEYVVWENVRGAYSAGADSSMEQCPGCLGADGGDGKHVLRALGRVLGDLSDLGFDAEWRGLRAADVGAPHGRFRVFVLARRRNTTADTRRPRGTQSDHGIGRITGSEGAPGMADQPDIGSGHASHPDHPGRSEQRRALPTEPEQHPTEHTGDPVPGRGHDGRTRGPDGRWAAIASDTGSEAIRRRPGLRQSGQEGIRRGRPHDDNPPAPAADAAGLGSGEHVEPRIPGVPPTTGTDRPGTDGDTTTPDTERGELQRRGRARDLGSPAGEGEAEIRVRVRDTPRDSSPAATDWGTYTPAIRRWEAVRGAAPAPTELTAKGKHRLSARFAEWMMGIDPGWVTDVPDISRNEQLKAIGNGVVPQQAAAALADMLNTYAQQDHQTAA